MAALGAAVLLAFVALILNPAWYNSWPRSADLPAPPINGITLLRALLLLQSVLLGVVAWRNWSFSRIVPDDRVSWLGTREEPNDISDRQAAWWLAGVTVLAQLLRSYGANADLWLDEISPILAYGSTPPLELVGNYVSTNNHLLNTLLLKLSIGVFGEHEWSVRLPAILFGVASIVMLWFCARFVLSRRASLLPALLLAVSYHHIFFSQNARGYSAYIFFALFGIFALIKGLREDRLVWWVCWVAAVVLGFASLLNTAFVVAAQAIVAAAVLWEMSRRGQNARPMMRRLLVVFGVAAMLTLQLYIVALPGIYVVITNVYRTQSTGFTFLSLEFAREVWRGVSAGFGRDAEIAAIPFLLAAGLGYIALLRRSWVFALAVALPGVLTALFLLAGHLTFSPRFFLLWLPLTMITAVVALESVLNSNVLFKMSVPRQRSLLLWISGALAAISCVSLKRYYEIPKQPYRAALAYAEHARAPNDLVVVLYVTELGVRYYGARTEIPMSANYRFVRTAASLDSVLAEPHRGRVWMLLTFARAFHMDLPEMEARLHAGWVERKTFPATVGDGSIALWEERVPASPSVMNEAPKRGVQ